MNALHSHFAAFFLQPNNKYHPKPYVLCYLPALWNGYPEDPLCLSLGGLTVDWTFFAVFAAPLIFIPTHSNIKVPKWFFYAFYPAHLAVIAALRFML